VTDENGARGIDYKCAHECSVVIASDKLDKVLLEQAMGRGSRGVNRMAATFLVTSEAYSSHNAFSIVKHLQDVYDAQLGEVAIKARILRLVHGKSGRRKSCYYTRAAEILNSAAPIYFENVEDGGDAYENWQSLRATWPKTFDILGAPVNAAVNVDP